MAIELWDLDDIKDYPKNAKKHPPEETASLANAIWKFGHDQPIVLDSDGVIIKGHGRKLACIYNRDHPERKGPRKAPVIVRRNLTKAQADAARLSDNAVVSTKYDTDLLREELARLNADEDLGVDFTSIGFTDKDLEFTTVDLGELSLEGDVFVEDISSAVETQKSENKTKEAEIDKTAAPIGDAFGFKRVTVEQSRSIREFMTRIETASGKVGIDALMEHIEAGA